MLVPEHDLYLEFKAKPSLGYKIKQFVKRRGIELTITTVGLFIGFATVLVSYKVGKHQEILQSSRMTDSYFNGIAELFAKTVEENHRVNLIIIARTDAIIEDLNRLHKPDKIASVVTFISNLQPKLFYKDESNNELSREKYIYLGNINLSGSEMRNITLEKARLSYSNLSHCDLAHTNFKAAVLKKANLQEANLNYVNFTDANLQGANFYQASIYQATFENANLENAIWINGIRCKKGSLGHCNY